MFNYDKLKEAITKSGKTQKYLCEKMNRPPYYLRDVIKQKNKISSQNQVILARELGVSVEWLNDLPEPEKKGMTFSLSSEVSNAIFDAIMLGHKKTPDTESAEQLTEYEIAVLNANERERNLILKVLSMSPEQQEAFLTLIQSAPSHQANQDDQEQI